MIEARKESYDMEPVAAKGASKRKAVDIADLSPDMVILTVKTLEGIKDFTVHKELACSYSPVLKAAFTGGFLEGKTQTMEITDTISGAVSVLIRWLYSRRVRNLDGLLPSARVLYNLWLLADKLLIPELQNVVMNAIEDHVNKEGVTIAAAEDVYKNTLPGSPLRRHLTHHVAFSLGAEPLTKEEINGMPLEFRTDLLIALQKEARKLQIADMKAFMVPISADDRKVC